MTPMLIRHCSGARTPSVRNAIAGLAMIAGAGSTGAQAQDSTQFRCNGLAITAIEINTLPPAIVGRNPSVLGRAVQHYLFQSATTRERAIRPFVLAHVGQTCED